MAPPSLWVDSIAMSMSRIFSARSDRLISLMTVSAALSEVNAGTGSWFGRSRDREQHHAGRDREVERVGAPPHGDLDEEVAGRREFVRQALLLIAHQEDERPRDDRRPIVRGGRKMRPDDRAR